MDAVVYPPVSEIKARPKIHVSTYIKGGIAIGLIILIKIVSLFPFFIEKYYSRGIYLYISALYRKLFGWLPFSVGDLFYFAAGAYLLWLFIKVIRALLQGRLTKIDKVRKFKNFLFSLAIIYVYFNLAWGLNYNRPGVAMQLGLSPQMHNEADLKTITGILLQKVNRQRQEIYTAGITTKPYQQVFEQAQQAYQKATVDYPFMSYKNASVKRSMYGRMGNFLGFLGYYNPFSGEAQLNLTMPRFLIPYVTCHEMAHQLGYASESEANFVGYLAATKSTDTLFQYSAYFDLFNYANKELYKRDSVAAKANYQLLDTLVRKDMAELKNYWLKSENPIEPVIKMFYDHYLKANQQRNGLKSYNEVVGWLIAYYKKYGFI